MIIVAKQEIRLMYKAYAFKKCVNVWCVCFLVVAAWLYRQIYLYSSPTIDGFGRAYRVYKIHTIQQFLIFFFCFFFCILLAGFAGLTAIRFNVREQMRPATHTHDPTPPDRFLCLFHAHHFRFQQQQQKLRLNAHFSNCGVFFSRLPSIVSLYLQYSIMNAGSANAAHIFLFRCDGVLRAHMKFKFKSYFSNV